MYGKLFMIHISHLYVHAVWKWNMPLVYSSQHYFSHSVKSIFSQVWWTVCTIHFTHTACTYLSKRYENILVLCWKLAHMIWYIILWHIFAYIGICTYLWKCVDIMLPFLYKNGTKDVVVVFPSFFVCCFPRLFEPLLQTNFTIRGSFKQ